MERKHLDFDILSYERFDDGCSGSRMKLHLPGEGDLSIECSHYGPNCQEKSAEIRYDVCGRTYETTIGDWDEVSKLQESTVPLPGFKVDYQKLTEYLSRLDAFKEVF